MKAEYISHHGNDLAVCNAARVSFAKESQWEEYDREDLGIYDEYNDAVLRFADAKLITYLAKHDHFTPFCHNSISLRMQAPVPIRTQC